MPAKLEAKLKKQYGADSDIPYKIMNAKGLMHGNKITAKGKAMEKEDALTSRKRKQKEEARKALHPRNK